MADIESRLEIDLGRIGYPSQAEKDRKSFRVVLDAAPMVRLIEHLRRAHRIYESTLVERPGDVWEYVWVVVEELSRRIRERMVDARERVRPQYGGHPWPEGEMPFLDFDRLFISQDWDTDPEDEAWLDHRESSAMREFARQLLAGVERAREDASGDLLVGHVLERARRREHAFDILDRAGAAAKSRGVAPNAPMWSIAFYEKLAEIVRDECFASVAYRGHGDWEILRTLATEQRRRAVARPGVPVDDVFRVSALVNAVASNDAWDSRIWFHDEGLRHGDLYVDDGGIRGRSISELVAMRHTRPRAFLTAFDAGDLPGYVRRDGDGWVHYASDGSRT